MVYKGSEALGESRYAVKHDRSGICLGGLGVPGVPHGLAYSSLLQVVYMKPATLLARCWPSFLA